MRWVIFFALVALFLIWDGLYNGGHYLDVSVRFVSGLARDIGIK